MLSLDIGLMPDRLKSYNPMFILENKEEPHSAALLHYQTIYYKL